MIAEKISEDKILASEYVKDLGGSLKRYIEGFYPSTSEKKEMIIVEENIKVIVRSLSDLLKLFPKLSLDEKLIDFLYSKAVNLLQDKYEKEKISKYESDLYMNSTVSIIMIAQSQTKNE